MTAPTGDAGGTDDNAPLASPAGVGLSRHERRRLLFQSVARILGIFVLLLVAYFAAPVGQDADAVGIALLTLGGVGFVALLVYQVNRILSSPVPQLRAAETLATVVPLIIVVFALGYVSLSASDPAAFSEPVTKVNGLYFTVTVLATVGFGDITALSELTRVIVTVQMLVDLLIVGVLVKVILGASRLAVERRRAEAEAQVQAEEQSRREGPAAPG